MRPHLGGTHGGLERGEAVVEGAEDGDHPVRVPLAPPQQVPQHGRPPRQGVHRLRKRRHRHTSSSRPHGGQIERKPPLRARSPRRSR
uniref:Uncharacterized protein n=1 Tax=Arundo donax TaxID=35708 RepID=A0A0A9F2S2_ARUDO